MGSSVVPAGAGRRAGRLALGLLCLGLPVLAPACSGRIKPPEYTDVSGKVLFKGQPLPGGRVTFVTTLGGFAASGAIDEKGNYKVHAPLGDVKIGVENDYLRPGSMGRGAPSKAPRLGKRPDAEDTGPPPSGKYKPIPEKYANPERSGLTYKVVPGPNTFDIKLE